MAEAIDDVEEEIVTTTKNEQVEPKVEIKQEIGIKKEQNLANLANESYEEVEKRYRKLKEESGCKNNEQLKKDREFLKNYRNRKSGRKWMQALVYFGIEPEYYTDPEKRQKIVNIYPFSEYSFKRAKNGEFHKKKIAKLVVELTKFEMVNDTYNVECKVSIKWLDLYLSFEKELY